MNRLCLRRALLGTLLTLGLWINRPCAGAEAVELMSGVKVTFASVTEGSNFLKQRDDFIAGLSPFERAARMVTNRTVSEAEFLAFVETNVVAWREEETDRMAKVLQRVGKKLEPWSLPFPKTILMIKSTGREEIEADYTRRNGIIIPENLVRGASDNVVIHELFHVLSRANPPLREKLYNLIGFQRINEVELTAELLERKWTNPDGVQNGWRLSVTNQNQEISVVPGLYAPGSFDYNAPVNPFGFFRLLVVTNSAAGTWSPLLVDGHPKILATREVKGFNEQIGNNTRYVIHPDEVLADNFIQFINGRTNAPTPRILERMRQIFTTP